MPVCEQPEDLAPCAGTEVSRREAQHTALRAPGREGGRQAHGQGGLLVAELSSLLQEWFSKADGSSADPEGHLQLLRVNDVLVHQNSVFRAL